MNLSIGRIQKTKPYLFADAIEVACAFGGESPVSKTDAFSLIQNAVAPGEESLDVDEPDLDDDNVADDAGGVEINKRIQSYIDECFRQIEYRTREFGDSYPFAIEGESVSLKTALAPSQKLYLLLLASSRIRTFSKYSGMKQRLADAFEMISKSCLKNIVPSTAEVIGFGPNSADRNSKFGTNLVEALPKLAEFMGMNLKNDWQSHVKPQGDLGIDLVGVQKLDDNQGGWSVFLGQCAAHEEAESWHKKRAEAKIEFYSYAFSYSVQSQAVLFIPVCFRQPNGRWAEERYTDAVILMDRVRILRQIANDDEIAGAASDFLAEHLELAG